MCVLLFLTKRSNLVLIKKIENQVTLNECAYFWALISKQASNQASKKRSEEKIKNGKLQGVLRELSE